jgi:hypothetical protein
LQETLPMPIKRLAVIVALLLFPLGAFAAEPVRRIGLEVQPFYQAA